MDKIGREGNCCALSRDCHFVQPQYFVGKEFVCSGTRFRAWPAHQKEGDRMEKPTKNIYRGGARILRRFCRKLL